MIPNHFSNFELEIAIYMKKSIQLFTVTMLFAFANTTVFSQSKIAKDELVGIWTVKDGSGDFDKESIGSTFDFQKSGQAIVELAPMDAPRTKDNEGKGKWTLTGNEIVINVLIEKNQLGDNMEMTVTKYENDLLYVTTKPDNIAVILERKK